MLGTRGQTQGRVYHSIKERTSASELCAKRALFPRMLPPFPSPRSFPLIRPTRVPGIPVEPSNPLRAALHATRGTAQRWSCCRVKFFDKATKTWRKKKYMEENVGFTHLLELKNLLRFKQESPKCFLTRRTEFVKWF